MPNRRRDSCGAADDVAKLGGRKATEYGDYAIVARDWMEAQWIAGQPEPSRGDATAAQIGNDDPTSGNAVELAHDLGQLVVGEVMKELRAHHDVDAVISKGQGEGRSPDGCREAGFGALEKIERLIETDGDHMGAASLGKLGHCEWNVRQASSNVEQCQRRAPDQQILNRAQRRPTATEQHIRSGDVPDRLDPRAGVDIGIIEDLMPAASRRGERAHFNARAVRNRRDNTAAVVH